MKTAESEIVRSNVFQSRFSLPFSPSPERGLLRRTPVRKISDMYINGNRVQIPDSWRPSVGTVTLQKLEQSTTRKLNKRVKEKFQLFESRMREQTRLDNGNSSDLTAIDFIVGLNQGAGTPIERIAQQIGIKGDTLRHILKKGGIEITVSKSGKLACATPDTKIGLYVKILQELRDYRKYQLKKGLAKLHGEIFTIPEPILSTNETLRQEIGCSLSTFHNYLSVFPEFMRSKRENILRHQAAVRRNETHGNPFQFIPLEKRQETARKAAKKVSAQARHLAHEKALKTLRENKAIELDGIKIDSYAEATFLHRLNKFLGFIPILGETFQVSFIGHTNTATVDVALPHKKNQATMDTQVDIIEYHELLTFPGVGKHKYGDFSGKEEADDYWNIMDDPDYPQELKNVYKENTMSKLKIQYHRERENIIRQAPNANLVRNVIVLTSPTELYEFLVEEINERRPTKTVTLTNDREEFVRKFRRIRDKIRRKKLTGFQWTNMSVDD